MATLQIADKPTLDTVDTDVIYIKDNIPTGNGSPTIVIKNTDSEFTGVTFTVSGGDFTGTVTMTDTTVEIDVPYVGTYTITWVDGSATVDVTDVAKVLVAPETLKIVSFTTGTDKEIAAMLDAYYNDEITWEEMGWAVGDTRVISLSSMQAPSPNSSNTWAAQDITVVIIAHDHTDLVTPINGHSKACITVQTRECMNNCTANYNDPGHIYANGDSSYDITFTKWSNLYMRTYINDKVWGAFPSTLKNAIKPSKHYRHTTYNGTASEEVTDNLFLPSYPEIFGTASYSNYVATNPVEGTQFPYYQTTSNRIKYGNNNGISNAVAQYWFEGSASSYYYSRNGYYWCIVSTNSNATYNSGEAAFGLAPAFAM